MVLLPWDWTLSWNRALRVSWHLEPQPPFGRRRVLEFQPQPSRASKRMKHGGLELAAEGEPSALSGTA